MNIKLVENFNDARAELRSFDRVIDATLSERLSESNIREKLLSCFLRSWCEHRRRSELAWCRVLSTVTARFVSDTFTIDTQVVVDLVDSGLSAIWSIDLVGIVLSRQRIGSTVTHVVFSVAREVRAVRCVAPFGRRSTGTATERATTTAETASTTRATCATTTTAATAYTERVVVRRSALVTSHVELLEVVSVERQDGVAVRLHVRRLVQDSAVAVADIKNCFEIGITHGAERIDHLFVENVQTHALRVNGFHQVRGHCNPVRGCRL